MTAALVSYNLSIDSAYPAALPNRQLTFAASAAQLRLLLALWTDLFELLAQLAGDGQPCAQCGVYVDVKASETPIEHGIRRCDALAKPVHHSLDTLLYDVDGGRVLLTWGALALSLPLPSRQHAHIYVAGAASLSALANSLAAPFAVLGSPLVTYALTSSGSTTEPSYDAAADAFVQRCRQLGIAVSVAPTDGNEVAFMWQTSVVLDVFAAPSSLKTLLRRALYSANK